MPVRSFRYLLWILAFLGLFADQASKYGVFAWLAKVESHAYALFQTEPERRYFAIVPLDAGFLLNRNHRGFFLEVAFEKNSDSEGKLIPQVNHGALFGIGRDYETLANGLFALISLLAAAAIIFWSYQKSTSSDRWLCIALGLILGGTLGNFYDRVMFNGVRDFLHWNYLFDWPVFNIADCCLVVGACLLLLQAFVTSTNQEPTSEKKGSNTLPTIASIACGASTSAQL